MATPWIKRPVVLLGIAFNAVYLTYLIFGGTGVERAAAVRVRKAPDTLTTGVIFYRSQDGGQFNVYPAEDLILVGEPGRRLLFSPLYSSPYGPPSMTGTVYLRFYSFSGARKYAADRQLRIETDGRKVWTGREVIYSANAEDKKEVVESLGDRMRLSEFAEVFGGRVVKITVGSEEIELSPGQLEALRRMVQCACGGACR